MNWNGATVREEPAIRAWATHDPSVITTDVMVPNDGLLILASNATDNGDGTWHYEYAVHNLYSDRSCGAFSVPVPAGANVSNVGFHDVPYHSGEPYSSTDWTPSVSSGMVVGARRRSPRTRTRTRSAGARSTTSASTATSRRSTAAARPWACSPGTTPSVAGPLGSRIRTAAAAASARPTAPPARTARARPASSRRPVRPRSRPTT